MKKVKRVFRIITHEQLIEALASAFPHIKKLSATSDCWFFEKYDENGIDGIKMFFDIENE